MCNVEGCGKEKIARGYCHRHYGQWRRGRRKEGDYRADEPKKPPYRSPRLDREIPPDEPGLVTHTPHGTILDHGKPTAYSHGCRCRACREHHRTRMAQNYQNRVEKAASEGLPETVKHGLVGTYTNWGCRCDVCRGAARIYERKKRA